MSRVLITGGAGMLGGAVAKRLLADPAFDVRISDQRAAPQWMREGCEIQAADLRVPARASAAVKGCSHVIHIAAFTAPLDVAAAGAPAHTLIEYENALHNAVIRAALDREVERFLYVSTPLVFERAELFPTPEEELRQCAPPLSARGFSRLSGERYCRAAHDEHGFPFTICRPSGAYGSTADSTADPGVGRQIAELIHGALAGARPLRVAAPAQQTITPTHVNDVADGLVAALGSRAALNEDLNLAASRELTVERIARIVWESCGEDAGELALEHVPSDDCEASRTWPAGEKARELLGWSARIAFEDGVTAIVRALRERPPVEGPIGGAV